MHTLSDLSRKQTSAVAGAMHVDMDLLKSQQSLINNWTLAKMALKPIKKPLFRPDF